MAIDFGLARNPGGGFLDALKAYDLGSNMRRQQQQFQREDQLRTGLQQAVTPSGQIDPQRAQEAYAGAGDIEGLIAYNKTLQGQHAEHAQIIGRLAQGAKDQPSWDAALSHALSVGAITPDEAQQYKVFTPETRAAAMAIGGVKNEDEAYTLVPGSIRMRGSDVVARSPYKPEIITTADGSKLVYNPNGDAPAQSAGNPSHDDVFEALIAQESGGKPGILGKQTQYGQAVGMTQLLPATARGMAEKLGLPFRPELLRGSSADAAQYQRTLGRAYFDEALEKSGGDIPAALAYYHGGPDKSIHGRRTRRYVQEVLDRVGGGNVAPGETRQISGPDRKAGSIRMTPEEVKAEGLNPAIVYYRNKEGVPTAVGGQDKKQAANLTEFQGKAVGLLGSMVEATTSLNHVEGYTPTVVAMALNDLSAKNPIKGELSQVDRRVLNAQLAFTNSIMRLESGAAIGQDEIANKAKTLFPMPGDGPEVQADKRRQREAALRAMRAAAGPGSETVRAADPAGSGHRKAAPTLPAGWKVTRIK